MSTGTDVQASFAATMVDEWVRNGVTDAVVAPGSRSTPLIVALAGEGRLRGHVVLDERSAGFMALGLGLAHGRPSVVVTTSGTAAAELHPAVIEAHQAGVPLIAVTADRPAELHGVGAPQTIEQEALFAGVLRWSVSPGVADPAAAGTWRSLAARSVAESIANPAGPGPVHLNLAFREPLLGQATAVAEGRPDGAPWHRVTPTAMAPADDLVAHLAGMAGRRGLIVAGGGSAVPVHAMAAALGWPVLADPLSGARVPSPWTVAAADALLRVPEVAGWRPEVVLRLGQPWASRVLSTWLGGLGPDTEQILVDPYGRWADPERQAGRVVRCHVAALSSALASVAGRQMTDWAARWAGAEAAAQCAIDDVVAAHQEVTEPALARTLSASVPTGSTLFVSSSMPVRDVEWYARPRTGLRVLANRGANGIDGIISTAIGVAIGGSGGSGGSGGGASGSGRVTALLGDLAFLYDAGALLWAAERQVDCTLVVVDNDGGGIFSFLPQAQGVARDQFERYWGTPHGLDLAKLAAAYRLPVAEVATAEELPGALEGTGVRVVVARTDRDANVAVHREIEAAVAAAVG